ncbi:MAG: hypothetical protein QME77_09620 [bacterium]|nr:hypothetical protein [bacterium]
MVVELKPYEVVAQCEIAAFPTAADVERMAAGIEKTRGSRPEVVRGAVAPPAIYRDRRYILDGRFVVWAADAQAACRAVEGLLNAAGIVCRSAIPSGRALAAMDVPQPRAAKARPPKRASRPARAAKPARAGRRASLKTRTPKNAPRRRAR